jgi:hypothetical protein
LEAGNTRTWEDEILGGSEAGKMGSYEGMRVLRCEDVKLGGFLRPSDWCDA